MAYVRRHWLSSVLYVAVIALGLTAFLIPSLVSRDTITIETAQAQTAEPKPVDPHLYTRVQALRQELSLTNQDLAAMGCTKDSATLILENLKTWCATNKDVLDQNHLNDLRARAALRQAIRQTNIGTGDSSVYRSLASLQQEVGVLYEQRKALIDAATAQLEVAMSDEQKLVWQSARANAGLPTEMRHVPGVTDNQRKLIRQRLAKLSGRESFDALLADELTWNQRQAIDSTRAKVSLRTRGVFDAEDQVLPKPPELHESVRLSQQGLLP